MQHLLRLQEAVGECEDKCDMLHDLHERNAVRKTELDGELAECADDDERMLVRDAMARLADDTARLERDTDEAEAELTMLRGRLRDVEEELRAAAA